MLSLLKNIRIFRDLDESQRAEVLSLVDHKVFKPGETVIHHNDNTGRVMLLCTGLARVQLISHQGREMVIRDIYEGEVFGDWSAIDGQARAASVITVSESIVGLMRPADFIHYVTHNPIVAKRQLQELTRQLRGMNSRMADFLGMKAQLRIQRVLLGLSQPMGEGLVVKELPGHQLIAAKAFTQREVVAKELNRLIASGVVVKSAKGLYIPIPANLDVYQNQAD